MLSHYVGSDQSDWDLFLPFLTFAYNTSTHESTGYSPFYLLHGYHPRCNVDQAFDYAHTESVSALQRLRYLSKARQLVRQRLLALREKMRERFDLTRRANPFEPGELVWITCVMHKPGNARKLEKQFRGPFRLISRVGANDIVVEDSRGKRDTVNAERLKPFYPRPDHLTLPCSQPLRLP